jgi:hypothetical protein
MHSILTQKPDSHIFGVDERMLDRGLRGICGSRELRSVRDGDVEYRFLEMDPEYLICTIVRNARGGCLVIFEHQNDAHWFADGLT